MTIVKIARNENAMNVIEIIAHHRKSHVSSKRTMQLLLQLNLYNFLSAFKALHFLPCYYAAYKCGAFFVILENISSAIVRVERQKSV